MLRNLTESHEAYVNFRIQGKKADEIAKIMKLPLKTINYYALQPLIQKRVHERKRELYEYATVLLESSIETAINTLITGCTDKTMTAVNIRSAEILLRICNFEPATKLEIENKITIIDDIKAIVAENNIKMIYEEQILADTNETPTCVIEPDPWEIKENINESD